MIKVRTVKPKLLDQVRHATRVRHLSYRTEQAYVHWIKKFISYFCFFSAVLILVTKILINSSVSKLNTVWHRRFSGVQMDQGPCVKHCA